MYTEAMEEEHQSLQSTVRWSRWWGPRDNTFGSLIDEQTEILKRSWYRLCVMMSKVFFIQGKLRTRLVQLEDEPLPSFVPFTIRDMIAGRV